MSRLGNKVALVTGTARGIGEAIADAFRAEGGSFSAVSMRFSQCAERDPVQLSIFHRGQGLSGYLQRALMPPLRRLSGTTRSRWRFIALSKT